jgi:flagellar assembly protein FliH
MSEFIRSRDFQPVNLAQAMAHSSGFRPYHFAFDDDAPLAHAPDQHSAWADETAHSPIFAEPQAQDDPFARGLAEGQRIAEAAHQLEREKLLFLISNCQSLQDEPSEELAQLIAETVERLVHQIVASAPIDAAWLKAQADVAAAMVAEADKARTLWVNPADAALLYDADMKLPVEADPNMMRGTVRLETSAGWIEHGRAVYLDELRAALGNQAHAE